MAPRRPSPWRDLAAQITQQVNDAVQQSRGNNPRRGTSGWQSGSSYNAGSSWTGRDDTTNSPYLSWDEESTYQEPRPQPGPDPTDRYSQPQRPRISSSDLSNELRGLLAETVGATTRSFQERREERKRTEPIRKSRGVAARQKLAAGVFGLVAVGFGGAAVSLAVDGDAGPAAVGGVVSLGAAGATVGSVRRSRRAGRQADTLESQLASPSSPYAASANLIRRPAKPLPPQTSAAYEPMRRLYAQERVLQQMIPEIQGVAPEIAEIAAASEQSLEQLSGRIVLLENAVTAAGGGTVGADSDGGVTEQEYGGLRTSLQRIVDRLSDGVGAHERLIGAAASVIAEMTAPTPGPTPITGLREAADGLQALASGFREVSRPHSELDALRAPSALDDVPDYGPPREPRRGSDRKAQGDH